MTDTDVLGYGPIRDWRVVLYPAGTTVADVLTAETVKQAAAGRTILAASVTSLPSYVTLTAAGFQDVVAVFGTVVVQYLLDPL